MMQVRRHIAPVVLSALMVGAAAAVVPVTSAAGGSVPGGKPVIAKPVTIPTRPVAGKPFALSFKVTRSDTHTRLLVGRMICDPSIAGKLIRHVESFRAGTARLAFVVPADAAGKQLKVKLTIRTTGASATRVTGYRVAAAPVIPEVSVAPASAPEGNEGTTVLSLPVTLSAATTETVSVKYATRDGTATAGSDYVAANGMLVFKPGETAKSVGITVKGDSAVEADETVTLALLTPVNAKLGAASATGTITNDDAAPRSGHYAGTTSQGRSIAFDVSTDLTAVSNIVVYTDVTCVELPTTIPDVPLDLTGISFPIGPNWSFGFTQSVSDPSTGSGTFALHGGLSVNGPATGTLRIDMALNTDYGVVHCSTGDVTWTAS
jgi:Calx-beta domain